MQHTGKAARRGYDKKIIYIKKEKRREKLWYVNIVELRIRTVLHSARDVERNLEAPVQPEAMAPEEIILMAETPQGFNGSTGGYAGNNGGFQGGNYNQNSNFNRSQLPNTASIPEEYQPISMWGYFGYELLFSIPLVGFILLLVFSFGGTKNKNLKNFARSYFCFMIVIIVLSIIFLGSTIGAALSYM